MKRKSKKNIDKYRYHDRCNQYVININVQAIASLENFNVWINFKAHQEKKLTKALTANTLSI